MVVRLSPLPSSINQGLLALVRLQSASSKHTKNLAELTASKTASLQAVVEDLAVQEVCQVTRVIQCRVGQQAFIGGSEHNAPFSPVLAKQVCSIP